MTTKSVTICHDSLKKEKTFNSVENLIKMIKDLNIEEHSGSFTVEGISGNYVFFKMDTKSFIEHIQSINMWNGNEIIS
tara:strand:- start:724 stop:957 length:234 start_codon:yes stop_codon:yes gene_type:complete